MNFDQKLKEVMDQYLDLTKLDDEPFQRRTSELLQDELQATGVDFKSDRISHSCSARLVAPGLFRYHFGDRVNRRPNLSERLTYEGENSLPAGENSSVWLTFNHKESLIRFGRKKPFQLKKIGLDFTYPLSFNNGEVKKPSRKHLLLHDYRVKFKHGIIYAEVEGGDGEYVPKGKGKRPLLKLEVPMVKKETRHISIHPNNVGIGLLTKFFEDIGYQGLDLLVH